MKKIGTQFCYAIEIVHRSLGLGELIQEAAFLQVIFHKDLNQEHGFVKPQQAAAP